MKKLFAFAFAAMMLAGCVKSPLVGGIYTDVKDGLAVTGNAGSSKVGTAEAKGYVGVVALGDASIHSITVSGIRCQDMRLRMKYVDIPVMLEENVETAIRKRIEDGVGNLYVLVNYTALFSTHNILKKMEGEKE